jgi:TetR/AcrR family transcriptional repressor of nem operon
MPKPNVREQLVDAGLKTLHAHGFNGCAVQDITQAAGVPKGSFYNHFESKEALALAALERFWDVGAERRELLADASSDPVDRLRTHFQMLSDAVVRNRFTKGCLIGNFSAEMASAPLFSQRLAEMYAAWTRAIAACVDSAMQQGRVHPGISADAVAAFLVNAWEGAVLRAKVEQDAAALDAFRTVVFNCVFTDTTGSE